MSRCAEKREETVAVAIDKDKGSQYALKWTVDHLLTRGQSLCLVHINQKGTPGNSFVADPNDEAAKMNSAKELFLPFRCFCTRKNIKCNEIIIEEPDVAKALINFVSTSQTEILVLGAPRSSLVRRFKITDVPSTVSKGAPDFCSVYVISKGKISSTRSATSSIPMKASSSNQIQHHTTDAMDITDTIASPSQISRSTERPACPPRIPQDDVEIKSPFIRSRGSLNIPYEASVSDCDISFVSSGRHGTDRMFPNVCDSMDSGMASRLSNGSEFDIRSFASSLSGPKSNDMSSSAFNFSASSHETEGISWSSQNGDDIEAEMRRLRLELKQTMDMYSTACKEALMAKQKAMELHRWKLEEEQRLAEARRAEEAALAQAEREKAKCKAAIEEAEAAKRIAELEAQKRMIAEEKALKESEGGKRTLGGLAHYDLRYRRYTIEEIEAATRKFSDSLKIGEGGYGPVFRSELDHTPVAIKVLRPDAAQGRSQFQQEVEVLSSIRHPNMVLLIGACPEHGCLVYEYMANGSLEDRLFRRGNSPVLPWQLRFRIAAEIATGLLFLHQSKPEPIVHRDLKPANILLDHNFVSKISDVGLARLVPPSVANSVTQYRMTATAGTFCYIDPEYQQTGMLGIKSDVYSLGVMLLQIITAKPPMGLTHHIEKAIEKGTFAEILDTAVPDWPLEEALKFAKLALQCTEMRRKDRPNLGKVVLPELDRLRVLAEKTMTSFPLGHTTFSSPRTSQSPISQEILSPQPSYSGSGYDSGKSQSSSASSLLGNTYDTE